MSSRKALDSRVARESIDLGENEETPEGGFL